jgi:hypothetical protein
VLRPIVGKELPDRDEEGLNDLLAGILERLYTLDAQHRYNGDVDSDIDWDTQLPILHPSQPTETICH